jgi:protein-S-isoprenylcysteine O-methyltransferase Ste14
MGARPETITPDHRVTMGRRARLALAGVAAVLVTAGLTLLTIELPRWLAGLVEDWVRIPGYHRAIEPMDVQQLNEIGRRSWDSVSRFIESNHLEAVGLAGLALVTAAILVGILRGRSGLALIGAVALLLPILGSFAGSMVFLVGIGFLRVLWLPAWGTAVMGLGDVTYLPYMAFVWPAWEAGLDLRVPIAYLAIGAGLLVFVVATAAWFAARLAGEALARGGIYRWSRHPQYLGWIVWSWGMMLLSALQPMPYGGHNPGGALAWTIATLVIVAVAWAEESHMLRSHGGAYTAYQARTPFLLPLPRAVGRLVAAPLRLVAPDGHPAAGRQILVAAVIYLAVIVILSLPFAALDWPPLDWWAWPAVER